MQVSSEMFSRTFNTRSSPTLSSSYIKQLLHEVFVISGIIKVEVLSAEPKAEADNTYGDLDYLGYLIIVLFYIVLKKITTNTPSQGTLIDTIVIGNHTLRA